MKKRSCLFAYFCACVSALVFLMSVFPRTALADDIIPSGRSGQYTADGDWTWEGTVTIVAQSASKYYDAPQFDDLTMLCVEYR